MKKYIIVFLFCVFTAGYANTWYVHPDSTLNSIQAGLDSCSMNDTVLVAAGTYVENIVWPHINGIKLLGAGRDNCIIDGDSLASVIRFDTSGTIDTTTIVRGFTITNGNAQPPWPNSQGGGIHIYASSPILEHLTITNNFADDFGGGIYNWSSGRPVIRYCVISNNRALSHGGIDIGTGSATAILDHVTVVGNDPGGAYFEGYARITNSIFAFNSDFGVRVEGSSFDPTTVEIGYSDINDGLQLIGYASVDSLGGMIDSNPDFVDYNSGNYHLLSTSPCIDAGDPGYPLDPDSTITDMGVFYFHQSGIVEKEKDIDGISLMPVVINPGYYPVEINLNINSSKHIRLAVYDVSGRQIKILSDRRMAEGEHTVKWDGKDNFGNSVDAGVYICSMESEERRAVRKFIILK